MKKRDLEKRLKELGFVPDGGSKHDKWTHPRTGRSITVPHHVEVNEQLAKGILKQARRIADEDEKKSGRS
jgi:predicted RNA binding protein YcfA (HicA-like mRNA interferase family)